MTENIYSKIEITPSDDAQIVITGEVAWDTFEPYYQKTLQERAKTAKLDGFRPGKAPLDAVESSVGQMAILSDAAQRVLGDVYPALVMENKLRVLGYPQISLTKLAHGSELGFVITTAIMPDVALPDYKKIAKKYNKDTPEIVVSDEELVESIDRLRNMYAHSMMGPHEHTKGDPDAEHDLPELDDEFVGKLGDFKNVADFQEKMKQDLLDQKINQQKGKSRESIIMDIAKESTFTLPDVLVEAEKDKMLAAMKDDISRMGLEYDKWLEHSGKTEDDIRTEMHDDATDRARAELVLKEIAQVEKLTADADKVTEQIEQITKMHPDAPEENVRLYVEDIYINEAVCEFLEQQ